MKLFFIAAKLILRIAILVTGGILLAHGTNAYIGSGAAMLAVFVCASLKEDKLCE